MNVFVTQQQIEILTGAFQFHAREVGKRIALKVRDSNPSTHIDFIQKLADGYRQLLEVESSSIIDNVLADCDYEVNEVNCAILRTIIGLSTVNFHKSLLEDLDITQTDMKLQ